MITLPYYNILYITIQYIHAPIHLHAPCSRQSITMFTRISHWHTAPWLAHALRPLQASQGRWFGCRWLGASQPTVTALYSSSGSSESHAWCRALCILRPRNQHSGQCTHLWNDIEWYRMHQMHHSISQYISVCDPDSEHCWPDWLMLAVHSANLSRL